MCANGLLIAGLNSSRFTCILQLVKHGFDDSRWRLNYYSAGRCQFSEHAVNSGRKSLIYHPVCLPWYSKPLLVGSRWANSRPIHYSVVSGFDSGTRIIKEAKSISLSFRSTATPVLSSTFCMARRLPTTLINKTKHLNDADFIIRLLYKHS